MDHIKKAILKAKLQQKTGVRALLAGNAGDSAPSYMSPATSDSSRRHLTPTALALSPQHLESSRIVAHLPQSPFTIGFDVLRTKIFQVMRQRSWKTLMVTSPTPNCGKTVTAINLAISLARQPNCFAVLVDCDFRKPQVANYLGFTPERDLYDVLMGQSTLSEAMQSLTIAGPELGVLATRSMVPRPSEVLSSIEMKEVVVNIRSTSTETVAVFDVPPMMVADDVLAFLPEIDGVLLVVAPGETSYAEVQTCLQSIPEEKFVGTVFTKSTERSEQSHYGYY